MKVLICFALFTVGLFPLHAATLVDQYDFIVNTAIPDNNPIGFSDTRMIASPITSITGVTVQISMKGGWAGDMYAYLTHASGQDIGFAVLLNRPGRTIDNDPGSGVSEFTIAFNDSYLNDVHTSLPSSGSVLEEFQPDAREIDPENSLDTTARTAFLSSFKGLDANGEWKLFVVDVVAGDEMILNSWALTIEGVPEPTTAILASLGLVSLLRRRRMCRAE